MAQYAVFGIMTGAFLLLATLGFALVSRVEKFLNIAHAELLSLSALLTWWLSAQRGFPFVVAAVVAIAVTAVAGLLIARAFYGPMMAQPPAILLITSVGVAFFLHGVLEAVFTPGIRSFSLPAVRALDVAGVKVHPYQLGVLAAALVSFLLLHLLLTRTQIGIAVRAIADNRELSRLRGIDVAKTTRYTWLIASSLAGLAGVALGVLGTITTDIAFDQILLILSVSILAGLGRLYGVLAAAFILGLAMDLSVLVFPAGYRSGVAFAAIILVLLFRPQGLSWRPSS
jgi:branched-chain amino acid transport system permease protein